MKKLFPILMLSLASLSACKKECDSSVPACKDQPPTNKMCAAAFNRWFYNAQTNQCQLISYSGCSQKGFATKQDCDGCVKNRK